MPFDFAASYEALNPDQADYSFYAALAAHRSARRVVDLGCGTGLLAVRLARNGCSVVGIDPDPEMLGVAATRDGADLVTWVEGDASAMAVGTADLVVMSGHVAQLFVTDASWDGVLDAARRGLAPGGALAFEVRNPAAKAWENWTRSKSLRQVATPNGTVEFWHETTDVNLPQVTYSSTDHNVQTGERSISSETLAFRDEETVRTSLAAAGLDVSDTFGSWDSSPIRANSAELIFVAEAKEALGD